MTRTTSYGEASSPTAIDRLGVWLSARQIRRWVPSFRGKRVADLGCGNQATFARTVLDEAAHVVLADVSLADDLCAHAAVTTHVGPLETTLPRIDDASIDVALAVSVLEHLWDPDAALGHIHRMLAVGGVALINVPSWRGKAYLELSAFRLGWSPAAEMNDHKAYYDPKDLWPKLVRAGFVPEDVRCFSHKLGLNTFAVCRKRSHA